MQNNRKCGHCSIFFVHPQKAFIAIFFVEPQLLFGSCVCVQNQSAIVEEENWILFHLQVQLLVRYRLRLRQQEWGVLTQASLVFSQPSGILNIFFAFGHPVLVMIIYSRFHRIKTSSGGQIFETLTLPVSWSSVLDRFLYSCFLLDFCELTRQIIRNSISTPHQNMIRNLRTPRVWHQLAFACSHKKAR